ncbi:MAG: amidohydrolase family protein [Phycisphaerae bacterium]|nr:amidohydrolase family protein [Phycisphaerae bacterium]
MERRSSPRRTTIPVIDAHNHLWGDWNVETAVRVMDQVGVLSYCDLTANVKISWREGGYAIGEGDIGEFFERCAAKYPGRFYCFTTASFAKPTNQPLFEEANQFVEEAVATLRDHVAKGARGLKILKELGLHYKDAAGKLIPIDDERLAPIFDEAGRLGVPVLMHQSDPAGFFEPITPDNEHYESLKKYPSWSFADPKFPRKDELIRRRDNVVARHPDTTFLLPHVANYAEKLEYVSRLLDEHPNVYIDFSARMDELGRKPEPTREFFLRYQDRILFGTDMPASVDMYRAYYRFLETEDEDIIPPDYDGTFVRYRWKITGLGLPEDVLQNIYNHNALKIIPGLKDELSPI